MMAADPEVRPAAARRRADVRLGIIAVPTALYRLYDATGALLYMGITQDLRKRMREHARSQPWWGDVATRTVTWYESWPRAFHAETIAIAQEKPKHNVAKRPWGELPPDRRPRRLRRGVSKRKAPPPHPLPLTCRM